MRESIIARKTAETDITLKLNLDGKGAADIAAGCGFLDPMLTLFASHGGLRLNVAAILTLTTTTRLRILEFVSEWPLRRL